MFQNPQSMAIKKYLFELLKERYGRNERFIERFANTIGTKEDYDGLGSLITDIYETGFLKAVNEYKDQFTRLGMNVSVVPEEKPRDPGSRIFGQSEKSG
jgi:hypothetical protein